MKIATIDGEMSDIIQRQRFATNPVLSLPSLTDIGHLAAAIASRKADVTFIEEAVAQSYLEHNPGTIRPLDHQPVRVFANTYPVRKGEHEFLDMLNVAIQDSLCSGEIQTITQHYMRAEKEILLPALPYIS